MPEPIRFHFDFLSPFGYFASLRIDDIAARHGRTADWHPMLIGVAVLKVMGLPPVGSIPLKGDYVRRDAERYVRRHAVPITLPLREPDTSPLPAGRLFAWLKRHHPEAAKPVARDVFHAYWVDRADIADPALLAGIAARHGLDRETVQAAIASPEAASLLRAAVDESLAQGVFGSPFVIVDGEPFFGAEKLELVEEWLATGGW